MKHITNNIYLAAYLIERGGELSKYEKLEDVIHFTIDMSEPDIKYYTETFNLEQTTECVPAELFKTLKRLKTIIYNL